MRYNTRASLWWSDNLKLGVFFEKLMIFDLTHYPTLQPRNFKQEKGGGALSGYSLDFPNDGFSMHHSRYGEFTLWSQFLYLWIRKFVNFEHFRQLPTVPLRCRDATCLISEIKCNSLTKTIFTGLEKGSTGNRSLIRNGLCPPSVFELRILMPWAILLRSIIIRDQLNFTKDKSWTALWEDDYSRRVYVANEPEKKVSCRRRVTQKKLCVMTIEDNLYAKSCRTSSR